MRILSSILGLAAQSLWANKLRSGLTLLGVLVGVMSVMTIISALEGIQDEIVKDVQSMGPATFVVTRMGIVTSNEMFNEKVKRKPFRYDMGDVIRETCDKCERMSVRSRTAARLKHNNEVMNNVEIQSAEHTLIDIVDLDVEQGRFISFEDDTYRRPVVFIGETVREKFFPSVDAIGKEIKLNHQRYTVIGVAKKKGSSFGGGDDDNFVMIPATTFVSQFGNNTGRLSFVVKAQSVAELQTAIDQVRIALRAHRNVPFNKPDDFDILTADNVIDVLNSITQIFRLGLVSISSISLVVGGIVVMNIMMVSVTERTREIGIRKSVGARQVHILLQFLLESLITTLLGGILGIVIGYFLAKWGLGYLDIPISPSSFAIFSGLIVSTGIGLIFGIYPAMKAARMDPIKALSYE